MQSDGGGALSIGDVSNDISITGCTFTKNYGQKMGGAVMIGTSNRKVSFNHCLLRRNVARSGAAIYVLSDNSDLTFNNTEIFSNQAISDKAGEGGGIYMYGGNYVSISNSVLASNSAINDGGAMYLETSNVVTISNTSYLNNTGSTGMK